jgi:DNA invertase Pin-like site-specific DNA recombinase
VLAKIYLRVSRPDQSPENQLPALLKIAAARGLTLVGEPIIDRVSGSKTRRAGLDELLAGAHRGDYQVVLCWAIDRLGRNMPHVVKTITDLDAIKCQVVSYSEPWLSMERDSPVRPLLIAVFAWAAQQERARLIERSAAGLDTARRNGIRLGRPKVTVDLDEAFKLRKQGLSIEATAKRLGCGVGTLHRALAKAAA